jgi:hypothetical protein
MACERFLKSKDCFWGFDGMFRTLSQQTGQRQLRAEIVRCNDARPKRWLLGGRQRRPSRRYPGAASDLRLSLQRWRLGEPSGRERRRVAGEGEWTEATERTERAGKFDRVWKPPPFARRPAAKPAPPWQCLELLASFLTWKSLASIPAFGLGGLSGGQGKRQACSLRSLSISSLSAGGFQRVPRWVLMEMAAT